VPVRNATRLSIAPTGTISILAGTTSGIEPFFALAFRRENVLGGERFEEIEPLVLERAATLGPAAGPLLDAVRRTGRLPADASAAGLSTEVFATAPEIPPEAHLRMQAVVQRHVDNAVSKTVNLPRETTPAEIAALYRLAHGLGTKGITVFREGSRERQVLRPGWGGPPARDEEAPDA
jgi:ribonucleoside-diphosphate reductase alpha chain